MKFKCLKCDNKGSLGVISNLKEDTKFLVKQWYKDNDGLIHTLIICLKCGVFHDCRTSFLGMFIGKPYKILGYLTKQDIEGEIANSLSKRGVDVIDDISLRTVGINETIFKYLSENGLDYNITPFKIMSAEDMLKEIEIPEHIKNSSLLRIEDDKDDFYIDDIDTDLFGNKYTK